ncbi:phage-related baseplate assembly protein [Sinorhizobium medicae]
MTEAVPAFFRLIDLSGVPVPDFVEALDHEAIRKSAIDYFVSLDPSYTALLESDMAIKIIEAFAYREFVLRQRVNDAARANTITESVSNDLDVIAAFFNTARLDGESDASLRRRAQLAINSMAVAGPRRAYEYHALSASTAVVDIGVHSPAAGEIVVTVLGYEDVAANDATASEKAIGAALFDQPAGGSTARILNRSSSAVVAAVRGAVSSDAVRPLTDMLTVRVPSVLEFSINATLTIYPGPDGAAVTASAKASLAKYLRSVRRVSYDATRSGIIAALTVPGVQNVILGSPLADIVAGPYDLPVCTSLAVAVDRVDV